MILLEINSKYVHSSLALHYFADQLTKHKRLYRHLSYTINQPKADIVNDLLRQIKRDSILFCAVYIWNSQLVDQICQLVKRVYPNCRIVYGGPELNGITDQWLCEHHWVDQAIIGEGDDYFREVAKATAQQRHSIIKQSPLYHATPFTDLDDLGIGYSLDMLKQLTIAYYESSRGCPYRCSYCVSSMVNDLRFKSMSVVKTELASFLNSTVKTLKFLDRTFNAPVERAIEIIDFIKTNDNGDITCHFELSPNLINARLIQAISGARHDLFQFEIGLQSANNKTLSAINRLFEAGDWQNVKQLCRLDNCHVHLDLIAGLPYEDYRSFIDSFLQVAALKPDHIQVGMLKLLNGTPLKEQANGLDYIYDQLPPYEFITNPWLSLDDKQALLALAEGCERVYNDDTFDWTNRLISLQCTDISTVYMAIGRRIISAKASGLAVGKDKLVSYIIDQLSNALQLDEKAIHAALAVDSLAGGNKLAKQLRHLHLPIGGEWLTIFANHSEQLANLLDIQSDRLLKTLKAIRVTGDYTTGKPLAQPMIVLKAQNTSTLLHFNEQGDYLQAYERND